MKKNRFFFYGMAIAIMCRVAHLDFPSWRYTAVWAIASAVLIVESEVAGRMNA